MQGLLLVTAVDSLQLVILTKGQRSLGIPDFPYVYIDVFVRTVATTQLMVPLVSLGAMMCLPGLEGWSILALVTDVTEICYSYRRHDWDIFCAQLLFD